MSELDDRLGTVGWVNSVEWKDYVRPVFFWMMEATKEIDRLRAEVDGLNQDAETRERSQALERLPSA